MTTNELIHAAALLIETSWEMEPDEFDARLASFLDESEDKIKALRCVCKAAEGRAATCKAEATAYATAAKSHAGNAERVKMRAFDLMVAAEATGEPLSGARLQANPADPLVFAPDFDPSALAPEYQRITVAPDAASIRQALGRGLALPGVALGECGRHLRWTEK